MDGTELRQLDQIVQQHRPLDRGQIIFHEGTAFKSLYVVRSGSFKTFLTLANGETQVIGFHLPGELIGFDAVENNRHSSTAEALERSSLCEIPFNRLSDIASKLAGLQYQIYRVMSREMVRDHEHVTMMGRKQAQERLTLLIKCLSDRHRALGHHPYEFTLSMSRHDIANYLGIVVETVSRLFTRLEEMGIIEVNRKQLRILDVVQLTILAGGDRSFSVASKQLAG